MSMLMALYFLSACELDTDRYFAFLSQAANSPITEIETPEGFRFDMDKDAFNKELNLHNTYVESYRSFYDKRIGKDVYKCQIQYDFEEGQLCSHGFWIETKK